jgi:uncharacterized protein involved in exopolysaccharide biosynthesis
MEESLKILKPYLRGLPIIILAMVLAILLAKKYLNYVTPMYESTVKLKLADTNEGVPDNNLYKDFDVFTSSSKIGGEIELLKSQVLLDKVFDAIDFDLEIYRVGTLKSVELYQNSPIHIAYSRVADKGYGQPFGLQVVNEQEYLLQLPGNDTMIKGNMGDTLVTPLATFCITLNDTLLRMHPQFVVADQYQFKVISSTQFFNRLTKNLDITSVDKDIAVLRISYKDASPSKAATLVNKLAEVYIQDYIETKYKAAHVTVNFLDDQINGTIEKLTNAENKIQAYRDNKEITNIRQETETDLRRISQLKIQQTNLKMNLEAMEDLEQYIKNGKGRFLELAPNFEAFTDLLSTEIVKKIKALEAEKKDLLITYTKEDERVKVIDNKIADLTDYLTESISNTRKNLDVKYRNLNNDIDEAEKVFIGVPEKEKMLNILDREFQIYQQSYNFLNTKRIEAEIAQAAKMAFHRIITPAQVSKEPVSPNRTIIIIVSAILGMFLALLFIFIVHSLKAKVNDIQTLESNATIPVAMTTPKLKNAASEEKHFLKEVIQLELKGLIPNHGILCLSSYRSQEGAAYNALHIAQALVMQDRKVLLIDVAHQLPVQDGSKGEIVTLQPNLHYTTMTSSSFQRSTKAGMEAHLAPYKTQYDVVVVLNQTLDNDSIALLMMSIAAVNMVVVDARLTPKKRIVETALLQDEFKLPSMYFLLNRYGYTPSLWREIRCFSKKKTLKTLTRITP